MKKILCFGDSNTYGFMPENGRRFDKSTRWTGILQELMGSDYEIIEAGCNNRTGFCNNPAGKMQTGYKILPELLSCKPDYVILSIGINDLQFIYNVSLEDVKTGLKNLIEIIRTQCPKAGILVTAPAQINENILTSFFATMFDRTSIEKSAYLDKIYKEVANEQNCDYLNLDKIAEVSEIDGLHFNTEAHNKVAREIFKTLQNY